MEPNNPQKPINRSSNTQNTQQPRSQAQNYQQGYGYPQQQGFGYHQSNYGQQGFGQQQPQYQQEQGYPQYRPNKQQRFESESSLSESFASQQSERQLMKEMRSQQRQLEDSLQLLPKRSCFAIDKKGGKSGSFLTNYFNFRNEQNQSVQLYKVQAFPSIKADANRTWARVLKKAERVLEKDIGMLAHRNDTIWGMGDRRKQNFHLKVCLDGGYRKKKGQPPGTKHPGQQGQNPQGKGPQPTQYTLQITPSLLIHLSDMFKQDNLTVKPFFIQMVNNRIKEHLLRTNYDQLGKGRFYERAILSPQSNSNTIEAQGLRVVNGFRFTLQCLAPQKIYLQIDKSTRVLRNKNLLEQMRDMKGSPEDIANRLIGLTVLARYGNYRPYVIKAIYNSKNPLSTFQVRQSGQFREISYAQYYRTHYGITTLVPKQPLILADAKVQKQIKKGKKLTEKTKQLFLIPELLCLVGLSPEQRQNEQLMKEVADFSRMNPKRRLEEAKKLVEVVNEKDKTIQVGNEPIQMPGNMLDQPVFKISTQAFQKQPYDNLNSQGKPKVEIENSNMIVLYSRCKNPEGFYSMIREATQTHNIHLPYKPEIIKIQPFLDNNQQGNAWINNLKEICSNMTIEQRKKTILVFAFDNSEAGLYNILKKTSLKDYTIRSQAFLSFSLIKQSQISVATNIGIQIAAKQGIPIWEVCKQSEYWADKRIATMALSFSRNSKGAFTLGLIGTVNNSQTQVFSFCKAGMSNREAIPKVIFEKFYSSWLSTYYSKEKALPDTLIIYRQGLAEAQVRKTVCDEILCLEKVISSIAEKVKGPKPFSPEVILLTVNKKVNSRFYLQGVKDKSKIANPKPGSVIYCEMSNWEAVDFMLVSHKVDESSCASPCQYRLVFYKPQNAPFKGVPFDNTYLPLNALAQFTFEQCHGYYNWTGSIKTPAVLQYTRKLSKLVGEHVWFSTNTIEYETQLSKIVTDRLKNNPLYVENKDNSPEYKKKMADIAKQMFNAEFEGVKTLLSSFYFL